MYMGFMKMGVSLMVVFFASFILPVLISANDVLICLAFMVWIFGFFHARNFANADDQEFEQIEDQFIWEEFTEGKQLKISGKTGRKVFAWILILMGAAIIWHNFEGLLYGMIPDFLWTGVYPIISNVPETIVALIIIVIGIKLIAGKKEALGLEDKEITVSEEEGEKDGKEN